MKPTNDLDIITLNVLEEFLLNFEGCVIIITHDRYFLDKIVDHLLVLQGMGKMKDFNYTYTEYRESVKNQVKTTRKVSAPTDNKKVSDYQDNRALKKTIKRIEKKLEKLESRKQEIHDWFGKGLLEVEKSQEMTSELQSIESQVEQLEEEWMEQTDGLD